MAQTVRRLQSASIDLLSGSMIVSGGRIDATQGSITGTFLGSDVPGISFKGSASFAPNTDSASFADTASFAENAKNAKTACQIAGIGALLSAAI